MCAATGNQDYMDLLEFDSSRYDFDGNDINYPGRFWHSAEGVRILLQFFDDPPDLPKPISDGRLLWDYYVHWGIECETGIIEVGYRKINNLDVVRVIGKKILTSDEPGDPESLKSFLGLPITRLAYLGSLTLPFESFYYILHVHCAESVIGLRGALYMHMDRGDTTISSEELSESKIDGLPPSLWKKPWESAEFDDKTPHDPLTLVRKNLDHIEPTIRARGRLRKERIYSDIS